MGDYSSDDDFYGEDEDDEIITEIELRPCGNCGRNFNVDSLPKHFNICSKLKQRKPFNSRKKRLAELENIPINPPPKKNIRKPKKKDWRWEHEQFIKNIRAARCTTKGGAPAAPATPVINPDYVQCPHCERRFNEGAAERHIEFCKEQKSRIPKQKSDSKYADKKEKQDKRATYRPPVPGQKKKSAGSIATKARSSSNSAPSNQRTKAKPLQPTSNSFVERRRDIKSDTTLAGRRKKISQEGQNGERVDTMMNTRYGKTLSASTSSSTSSSGGSITEHDRTDRNTRSGKTKAGAPKWFEDLKRNDSSTQLQHTRKDSGNQLQHTRKDSGNQLRHNSSTQLRRNVKDDFLSIDSGMELNEHYIRADSTKSIKDSPVGVVRPSSRYNENDLFPPDIPERTPSSGRRKMATFCHGCGTRYPVNEAKFCCECGVRRMALT